MHEPQPPGGEPGTGVDDMTTTLDTQAISRPIASVGFGPITLAVVAGLALVFFANFAGATVLHDAAHDARHALAVPCH